MKGHANLPKYIIVTLSYQVVHEQPPNLDFVYDSNLHHFYGGPMGDMTVPGQEFSTGPHVREIDPRVEEEFEDAGFFDSKLAGLIDQAMDAKQDADEQVNVKDIIRSLKP